MDYSLLKINYPVFTGISELDYTEIAMNGLELILSQSASASATIDFTTVLNDTYDGYQLVGSSIKPATDNTKLQLQIGTGGTPTYQTLGYAWSQVYTIAATQTPTGSTSDTHIGILDAGGTNDLGNAAGENGSFVLYFNNPEITDFCNFTYTGTYNRAADSLPISNFGGGTWSTAGAITAIRFLMSSGNIASGRFTLYGYRKVA